MVSFPHPDPEMLSDTVMETFAQESNTETEFISEAGISSMQLKMLSIAFGHEISRLHKATLASLADEA
jgi:hypothetical protein